MGPSGLEPQAYLLQTCILSDKSVPNIEYPAGYHQMDLTI
ncbi:hypothetical protein KS4_24010 [Poriferisphaera corsica]|uniref:Uncharacterized protein n=1 Tax=Poriferisphaera corsica TaxID=2528020 RepID=A0A517YVV5_9BACT|nr:hypothetical protein KS4_24010 [Poriferisphaera corsica]